MQSIYPAGALVLSAGLVPPHPTGTTPEPEERYIWSPYGWYEVIHKGGSSVIRYIGFWMDQDLNPVPEVEMEIELEQPDGGTQNQSGASDDYGMVELDFDIFTYGAYFLRVENVVRSGYQVLGHVDRGTEWPVKVDANQGVIPFVPPQVLEFYESFNLAMLEGNVEELLSQLYPEVFSQYSEDQCRAYLDAVVENPVQVEVQGVPDFGPWLWAVDSTQVEIPNSYTIDIKLLLPDGTIPQQTHLGLYKDEGGVVKAGWFTYCDALEGD